MAMPVVSRQIVLVIGFASEGIPKFFSGNADLPWNKGEQS